MSSKYHIKDNIAVVCVKGKLMGGKETDACHLTVKDAIGQGYNQVVADLSHVKWVNSKGLGMLMACFTSCKNAGGDFKLAGATEKTRSLLMMTKLLTVFDAFDTVDEAIAAFPIPVVF